MKQTIFKPVIYLFCVVLLFMHISNIMIGYDSHIFECEKENCSRCIYIEKTQKVLKSILDINGIIFILVANNLVNKIIIKFKNIFSINLITMKVQLNE